ncbi:MAG: lipoyl(octanoyl) transferase LipB [Candidatus Marinimicrobia bacterium]|nr:lipoyl(octanoyl) transferase LipB [Candidatus Neomarinimicrobiota bacterium]
MAEQTLKYEWLGRQAYRPVWDYQHALLEQRVAGEISDRLLFVEHDPTYTLGKAGDTDHLLASQTELSAKNIDYVPIDRGGDITYHGPGQLVGYPILHLENYKKDVHWYLRQIEEVIIQAIAEFGIQGTREPKYTGVWVGEKKIAAIGVKVSRWVTMHGFALNVHTDLSYFNGIVPCGITHKQVGSIESILGRPVQIQEVAEIVLEKFAAIFHCRIEEHEASIAEFTEAQTLTDEGLL